jgi:hypothetical protein
MRGRMGDSAFTLYLTSHENNEAVFSIFERMGSLFMALNNGFKKTRIPEDSELWANRDIFVIR